MDFIANATGDDLHGPERLDAGAPEDGRRPADARRAAPDRPGHLRGGPQPVIASRRLMKADEAATLSAQPAGPTVHLRARCGPRAGAGSAAADWAGWLFVLPALLAYAAFVLVPLALTVQYSTLRWNGIGPSDVRRHRQLRPGPDGPRPRRLDRERVQAHHLLQRHAGRARTARRVAHPAGRDRRARHGHRGRCCSCPRSSRSSRPASCGAGCSRRAASSTRSSTRSAWAASRGRGWRTSRSRCPRWASSAPGCCWVSARSSC